MMLNDKKKHSAGKDKSYSTNSSQNLYSTVPRNDAVEVGEMMTRDHDGTSGGLDDDGERTDQCLQVAWPLREKPNDFVEGGKGGPPGLELRSSLNVAASLKIVSVDSKQMSPVLWRTLPKELVTLVLARLLVPDIARLRSLSKEWNRDMATVNSEINRACDETSPTTVAVFSMDEGFPNEFLVTICTQRSQYSYRLHPGNPIIREDGWHDMGARDGGLVCFVSTWRPSKANPLCIVVVNLLTRVQRKFPPLQHVYLTPPKMMHIEVDTKTKCYRVVVVGENTKGHPTIEIYDSGARQWTKATPPLGFIFGVTYRWQYCHFYRTFRSKSPTGSPSVYDFGKGQLKRYDEEGPSEGASVMTYALQKDCMFVLHRDTSNGENLPAKAYCITKYRIQNNAKDWVQERSYLCSPFEALLEKDSLWRTRWITLKACEGFLMVITYSSRSRRYFWLLDLSSGEWSSLPSCFEGHKYGTSMSRAFWNVVP